MEIDAVDTEIILRLKEKNGVLYLCEYFHFVKHIGDRKTFNEILNVNPYGDEATVMKKGCVSHVKKRMSTRWNNNESLNSLIWIFAPKHLHSGAKIVRTTTFLTINIFNKGFLPILKIMSVMRIASEDVRKLSERSSYHSLGAAFNWLRQTGKSKL